MNHYVDILEHFLISTAIKAAVITVLILGLILPLLITSSLILILMEIVEKVFLS